MLIRLLLLFEILAIFVCLYELYGGMENAKNGLEKFLKLDICTIAFISVDVILVYAINVYHLNHNWTLIMYPIILLYCGLEYGFKLKPLIVNNILYIVILSGLQFLTYGLYVFVIRLLQIPMPSDTVSSFIINLVILVLTVFGLHFARLNKLSNYLQQNEILLKVSLIISFLVVVYCLLYYKNIHNFNLLETFLLLGCIVLICVLAGSWGKYKAKAMKSEAELKMHELYDESFSSLVTQIRLRQHDFDNHINAIYSQHYIYKNYEELVAAQKQYCDEMIQTNKFHKLLTAGNSVVIGFLYGKFLELEEKGLEITYKVQAYKPHFEQNAELERKEREKLEEFYKRPDWVPDHVLVELLGNLLDNAADALLGSEMNREIHVEIIAKKLSFRMEVRNRSEWIPYEKIKSFFVKGKSSKGSGRGLGLYHVKELCNRYKIDLSCSNEQIEDENWICFVLEKEHQ